MARENPGVQFFHCGGLYEEGKHPKNIGIYFGFIDEVEYLSGMLAGLATRTNKLGFVAAKPIPQVLRNINSFTAGRAQRESEASPRKWFSRATGSFPCAKPKHPSSLVDQGIDVLTGHTGSPRVIVQTAERRGVFGCGYQFNQSSMAPHGFLTGAEWAWGTVYLRIAEDDSRGKIRHGWQHSAPLDRHAQGRVLQTFSLRPLGHGACARGWPRRKRPFSTARSKSIADRCAITKATSSFRRARFSGSRT